MTKFFMPNITLVNFDISTKSNFKSKLFLIILIFVISTPCSSMIKRIILYARYSISIFENLCNTNSMLIWIWNVKKISNNYYTLLGWYRNYPFSFTLHNFTISELTFGLTYLIMEVKNKDDLLYDIHC